ncbi:alginate export family protein [Thalassomonas sp. M1454]|uniref:alginate export family protein n=1 Tax=Thalassomonas sp. M1454 TaxID=2594477 RepID=UPI0011816A2E|nr:alginate export family protein [Thalassomonas sp. M1454]TRX53814.1 hypothetical protein FNN08_12705 [Thalassomonas sp. M1454]
MKSVIINNNNTLKLSSLALALLASSSVNANVGDDLSSAVKSSKVDVSLRYRVEAVDQDSLPEEALASTLKSRLTVTTGKVYNFGAQVEVDDVTYLGNDSFNSTINGNTDHPVVADPEGTEVNQASLSYFGKSYTATAGRQRINLDDQRFIGGVAWRQNEQTFDGYRLQMTPTNKISLDLSYLHNVNRIFGEDNQAKSDLHGAVALVNAKYKLNKEHAVTAYYYGMEFDSAATMSNDTIGATYNGNFPIGDNKLVLKVGVASQSDAGDNPNSYDATYSVVDATVKFDKFSVGAGIETLGSDNGVGFQTPLATAHKFQGFSDQFLSTPGDGIQDTYIKGATKLGPVALSAAYHVFSADDGDADFGDEINLVAAYKVNKQISTMVKAASYSADDHNSDTTKLWFMVSANF